MLSTDNEAKKKRMDELEVKRMFPGKSIPECYKACQHMVEKAGYKIFKKRDIASLLICEGQLDGKPANLTVMIPFGSPTSIILSLTGDGMDETALNSELTRLFAQLEKEL
jgi:hypothetical protein